MACHPSIIFSFLTLIILYYISPIAAQSGGRITVGQSLSATGNGSSWLSTSGDFAFGFHQFPNNSSLFLLAIWYAKIPDTTIVWYANDGHPIPQGSSLDLTADGLLLNDPEGNRLWSTTDDFSGDGIVSYGFMNDTGNFVLKSSTDDAVWKSFDKPADTLLPTQILEAGGKVYSRRSESNFTKGRFLLRLHNDGNLILSTRDLDTGHPYDIYYASGTKGPVYGGNKVIYDETGRLYIQTKNGSVVDLNSDDNRVSADENYLRVTLDSNGVLTWYYHPRTFKGSNTNDWVIIQSLPNNICLAAKINVGSGACGYNSICSLDKNQRPTCQCPPNYSPQDPDDKFSSCIPDFKPHVCEKQDEGTIIKDQYKLVSLQNTDWPLADYAQLNPCSEDECKHSCLNDCFCAVAIFNSQNCWKKMLPLSNGKKDSKVDRIAWLKVGNGSVSNYPLNQIFPPEKTIYIRNKRITAILIGYSIIISFLLLTVILLGIYFKYNRKRYLLIDEQQIIQGGKTLREYSVVHCISYEELEEATNGFEQEIGKGAFGTVYKGEIKAGSSSIKVAVKKLHRISKDADKEFETEVNVIGQTHHKNLVRFIGFCKEEDQRLLIYEYMTNGTVADYLFSDLRPSWTARIQIALGIAKGILYLHEECITQIIHCDIKPQNILLDDDYNARISDFGLAKLLALNQTHTETGIRGTKGYLAPEWFRTKTITVKVDVYGFGTLLLEIICCRRNVRLDISGIEAILTDWAFDCYQANTLDSLISDDVEALDDIMRVERFAKVALWCIQEDPRVRPTMKRVTQMLEGVAEVHDPPCPTSFSIIVQS